MYSGIFAAAEAVEEIAAVLGHEIAHTLAHHEEAGGSAILLCGAISLPSWPFVLAGLLITEELLIFAAPAIVVAITALLALSRGKEAEADKIGMLLMAEAGFNPEAVISFWKKMDKIQQQMLKTSGGKQTAEYMSTHPHVSRDSWKS